MTTHTIEVEIEDPDKIITSTYLTGVAKAAAEAVQDQFGQHGVPLDVNAVRITQYTASQAAATQGVTGGFLKTEDVPVPEAVDG